MPEGNQVELAEKQLAHLAPLKEAARDFESRIPRVQSLPVVDYQPANPHDPDVLVPPGSVTLFLTRARSPIQRRLRQALDGVRGRDVELARDLRALYRRRPMVSLETAVDLLKRQDVVANLHYGSTAVARNLFLPPDLDIAVVPLPYNGGRLLRTGFKLVQGCRPGTKANLEGLLVRHSPPLTPAERAAIRGIPIEAAPFNVGDAANCYAITGVAIVMVVMFATYGCPGAYADLHLDDQVIKQLGPEAAARELLGLRRTILEKRGV